MRRERKWKVAIIKEYTTKEPVTLYGETPDIFIEDYCKKILKENKMRNVGSFIVIQAIDDFAYITEYSDGIDIKDSGNYRIIAIKELRKFKEALDKLLGEEVRE